MLELKLQHLELLLEVVYGPIVLDDGLDLLRDGGVKLGIGLRLEVVHALFDTVNLGVEQLEQRVLGELKLRFAQGLGRS